MIARRCPGLRLSCRRGPGKAVLTATSAVYHGRLASRAPTRSARGPRGAPGPHKDMEDIIRLSALQQSALLRGGSVSVAELTRAYLDRIERLDPSLNAFVQYIPGRAMATAQALDRARRRGEAAGPLWGLPTAMKDLHLTRGMFVRLGSRAFRHLWSPFDDASSAAVRRAGMVMTGKLATSELAILPIIDTDLHPPTRNPWDLSRYSGGSSGGSSAAIAAGLMPVAVASDGGGSIRIPAAFCGLVGHKPTRDLVFNPLGTFERLSISVIGPHARSVDDAAALLDALIGPTRNEPFLDAIRAPLPPLRVRFTTRNPVIDTDPEIAAQTLRAARALADMGHHVEEGRPFEGTAEEFLLLYYYLVHNMFVPFASRLQPTSRWLRERGRGIQLTDALARREVFRSRVDRWFEGVDLWLTPTVAVPPPRVGVWKDESPEGLMRVAAPLGAFTAIFNASGNPATSVPLWSTPDGRPAPGALPAGIQLVAPRGQDRRALAVARALLEALGTPLTPLAPLA